MRNHRAELSNRQDMVKAGLFTTYIHHCCPKLYTSSMHAPGHWLAQSRNRNRNNNSHSFGILAHTASRTVLHILCLSPKHHTQQAHAEQSINTNMMFTISRYSSSIIVIVRTQQQQPAAIVFAAQVQQWRNVADSSSFGFTAFEGAGALVSWVLRPATGPSSIYNTGK